MERVKTVGIVIPTLNEADQIGQVLASIPTSQLGALGYRAVPVVVDGNSVDGTAEAANQHGAVVLYQEGHGKGRALRQVFRDFQFDYGVVVDGDGTYPVHRTLEMMAPLSDGADIVLMARVQAEHSGKRRSLNRIGNRILTGFANLVLGTEYRDLCTGMWGFKARVVRSIEFEADGFDIEAEVFARVAKSGFNVRQLEIPYLPRRRGSKLRPFRDGFKIYRRILREAFRVTRPIH